jgi:membrane protein required for colicin V production
MEEYSVIDIVLAVSFAWALFNGFRKGLIIKVASIVALIVGVYAGFHFSSFAGEWLSKQFNWSGSTLSVGAFVLTFLGVVIGIHFMAKLLEKVVDLTALSMLNKLGGMAFGMIQVLVLLSVLSFTLDSVFGYREWLPEEQVERSLLYPTVESAMEFIIPEANRDNPWEAIQSKIQEGTERLEEATEGVRIPLKRED